MRDLIERLRAAAPGTMLSMQVSDLEAVREAADEIERLRVAVRHESDCVEAAKAEIERLRAALRCERESGMCVMVHDPERQPCTPENCNTMRGHYQQSGQQTPEDGERR